MCWDLFSLGAALSASVYNQDMIDASLRAHGFSRSNTNFNTTLNLPVYAMAEKITDNGERIVVIVIRGSQGDVDWFNAFDYRPLAPNSFDGYYHGGFDRRTTGIINRLRTFMGGTIDNNTTYFITGHSQGGAIANLMAKRLMEMGIWQRNVYAYTFASPNVARYNWFHRSPWNYLGINDNIFNLINVADPITEVPQAGIINRWGRYGTDELFSTLGTAAHSIHTYLDWALGPDSTFSVTRLPIRSVAINSPVDVEIINANGIVVGRIIDNVPEYVEEHLGAIAFYIGESSKYVYMRTEAEFTIRLTATDSGTMGITVRDIAPGDDTGPGKTLGTISFGNVSLTYGREMLTRLDEVVSDIRLLVIENGQPVAEVLEDGREIPYATSLPFTDVRPAYWFYPYVRDVFQRNIMQGNTATTFAPNDAFTRAMVVGTLYRMVHGGNAREIPYARNRAIFSDVDVNAWYSPYVAWAYDNGLVGGVGGNRFAPGVSVTREEFAVLLHRFAGFKGHDTTVRQGPQWNSFTDRDQISTWAGAREALIWANYHGLITGRPPALIVPGGTAVRAEAAGLLVRYIQAFGEITEPPQRPPTQSALDVRALLGQNINDVRHLLGEPLDMWEWYFFTDIAILLHYPGIIAAISVYYPALDENPDSRGRANVTFGSVNGHSTRADVRNAFGTPHGSSGHFWTDTDLVYYYYYNLGDVFVYFYFNQNGQLGMLRADFLG